MPVAQTALVSNVRRYGVCFNLASGGNKRMPSARALMTFVFAIAFAAAVSLAFAPMASAQTMGEYGATVGNAAASAGSVPSISPPNIGGGFQGSSDFRSSGNGGASGSSQTVVVSGGGSDYAAPRTTRSHNRDKNTDSNSATDDWVRVR